MFESMILQKLDIKANCPRLWYLLVSATIQIKTGLGAPPETRLCTASTALERARASDIQNQSSTSYTPIEESHERSNQYRYLRITAAWRVSDIRENIFCQCTILNPLIHSESPTNSNRKYRTTTNDRGNLTV